MAASNGRKTASSNNRTTQSRKRTTPRKKRTKAQVAQDSALFHEIGLIVLFAAMLFLFCCNFGLIGPAGDAVSGVLFGLFGLTAYALPVLVFLAVAFYFANEGNPNAARKLAAGVVLFFMLGIICDLVAKQAGAMEKYDIKVLYEGCRTEKAGGGVLAGSVSFLLQQYLETIGTVLVVLLCTVVSLILLTEKSLLGSVKKGSSRVRELSREDAQWRREQAEIRRQEQEENARQRKERAQMRKQEQEENRARKARERKLRAEEKENEKILRMEKKVSGVMLDTTLSRPEDTSSRRDDIHEIILAEEEAAAVAGVQETYTAEPVETADTAEKEPEFDFEKIPIRGIHQVMVKEEKAGAGGYVEESRTVVDFRGQEDEEEPFDSWGNAMEDGFGQLADIQGFVGRRKSAAEEAGGERNPFGEGISGEQNIPGAENRRDVQRIPLEPGMTQIQEIPIEDILKEGYGPESESGEAVSGDFAGGLDQPGDGLLYGTEGGNPENRLYGAEEQNAADQPYAAAGGDADSGLYGADSQADGAYAADGQRSADQPYGADNQQAAGQAYTTERQRIDSQPYAAGEQRAANQAYATEGQRPVGQPYMAGSQGAVGQSAATAQRGPGQQAAAGPAGSGMGAAGQRPVGQPNAVQPNGAQIQKPAPKPYMLPPLSLLQKGVEATGDSTRELRETAQRLQQTLGTFGVKVTITDISQGPSVTRYELQPEQGVKVSKIVGLTDDIKMHLAATDIRIEAPIPGKAAIGIEVPNKENMAVALRDLLESREFREFPSRIAFAVGKDIAGQTVVSDIAKMPHMLIAGATGSGKSVCINTLIMSILYKARPDEVKLIMVDPKVVELSIYNGIPHLLIPVVTDPKKASAALHWGVSEMEDRYRKFAEFNVRDLKGYNKKVEAMREKDADCALAKLPQIVIIVDELADLMMVCPGEVEESICRLAQLARACGIHLIIATQRPSVDVITGLIKANMPSRVAFSVSSGVDSRTILDMVGAEKLLGKGDMLFYPQGYAKPARIQGAFVSDQEVSDVVDFLKNQALGNTYAADIEEKIANIGSASGGGKSSGGSDVDGLFEKAGRLIIDKDKASIGMLQRALQIGFNRAARIMDQLCQYGVVGEEEGTKPRKILMSPEQFDQILEEIV